MIRGFFLSIAGLYANRLLRKHPVTVSGCALLCHAKKPSTRDQNSSGQPPALRSALLLALATAAHALGQPDPMRVSATGRILMSSSPWINSTGTVEDLTASTGLARRKSMP